MSFSRTTDTGRRITATPRLREEPDTDRLVALVMQLAEQLHHEEAQDRAIHARDDRASSHDGNTGEAGEGHDHDTLTANSARS